MTTNFQKIAHIQNTKYNSIGLRSDDLEGGWKPFSDLIGEPPNGMRLKFLFKNSLF